MLGRFHCAITTIHEHNKLSYKEGVMFLNLTTGLDNVGLGYISLEALTGLDRKTAQTSALIINL